ncbi:hypothetical protein KFE25_004154 [Diacronema lutheri]|uniref:Uncharacterized protein n=1 Tax=Diacronema lutheri TaxID=2081491 RepID=A0A8J5X1R4_DIALT|nr:hypothetical protein KFE25_004154 [Diacronema lutheri]
MVACFVPLADLIEQFDGAQLLRYLSVATAAHPVLARCVHPSDADDAQDDGATFTRRRPAPAVVAELDEEVAARIMMPTDTPALLSRQFGDETNTSTTSSFRRRSARPRHDEWPLELHDFTPPASARRGGGVDGVSGGGGDMVGRGAGGDGASGGVGDGDELDANVRSQSATESEARLLDMLEADVASAGESPRSVRAAAASITAPFEHLAVREQRVDSSFLLNAEHLERIRQLHAHEGDDAPVSHRASVSSEHTLNHRARATGGRLTIPETLPEEPAAERAASRDSPPRAEPTARELAAASAPATERETWPQHAGPLAWPAE